MDKDSKADLIAVSVVLIASLLIVLAYVQTGGLTALFQRFF